MVIVDNAPISSVRTDETIGSENIETVEVSAFHQCWRFALTPFGQRPTDATPLKFFPAVIDQGHNGTLSIGSNHIRDWLKVDPDLFPKTTYSRSVRFANRARVRVPLRMATLWMFTTKLPGNALEIPLLHGFEYFTEQQPPIPLVGAEALNAAKLAWTSNYGSLKFSVAVNSDHGPFGQFLVREKYVTAQQVQEAVKAQMFDGVALSNGSDPAAALVAHLLSLDRCPAHRVEMAEQMIHDFGLLNGNDRSAILQARNGPKRQLGKVLVEMAAMTDDDLSRALVAFKTPKKDS